MHSLPVTEIFHSIQGESTWAGSPCTFVRLTGCPLRCVWCDTAYAFRGGEKMSLDDIVSRVREIGCPLVEITGGEPLAHRNAFRLVARLLEADFTVLVETSGSEDISELDPRARVIMDLKCPDSGECDRNRWENLVHLGATDEVKFVVAGRSDYEWSRAVIRERGLDRRVRKGSLGALLLSPVWGQDGPGLECLAKWVLEDRLPARLQTQLHKHIWGPDRRGV
ncbi:MAG: radical SAM protein [Gammaproteobacteria bacterium]|nr:radical SAM protein [Gammaproteobacteria bacterium]MDE0246532.1 radical SAM protein [Gammaproteobacteria bacterium]